jgi:pimeloyl-ACP methyl ester carboxylesterase
VLECPGGLVSVDPKIKRVNRALLEHYGATDGKDAELLERVAAVGHPTLILQGADDGTIPPASAELLAGRLRRATLVVLPQAGHDLEMDQPARVLAAVRDFLERPAS